MRAAVHSALPLISASQITLFRECARKWAWRYIAKIQTPQHPAAALGTEVDDTQLQPYLRDGRPFDYSRDSGYIAASGLAFLPEPKLPGLEVQKHFVLPSPAGKGQFAYQGYMDLYLPDSGPVPGMPGGAPFVGDFKTTSDLKWAKSEKTLSEDVQAMLYATDTLFKTRAERVDLGWIYFQTRGARKSKRTHLRVTTDHVVEQFKTIEQTARELFEAKSTITDPLKLPPTPSQCDQYGGCPYRHLCNLSPSEVRAADSIAALAAQEMKGIEMSSTEDLMASLAARKAAKAGAQAPHQTNGSSVPAGSVTPSAPSPSPSLEEHVAKNPRAEFLLGGKAMLGINSPEKDSVAAAGMKAAESVPDAPVTAPATPAAKRGRPKKTPAPAPEVIEGEIIETPAPRKQLELPYAARRVDVDAIEIPTPKTQIDVRTLAEAIVDTLIVRFASLGGSK